MKRSIHKNASKNHCSFENLEKPSAFLRVHRQQRAG